MEFQEVDMKIPYYVVSQDAAFIFIFHDSFQKLENLVDSSTTTLIEPFKQSEPNSASTLSL